jgi:calpain-7
MPDGEPKQKLESRCRGLLDQAETIQKSKQWQPITTGKVGVYSDLANAERIKVLEQPKSTRILSTREKIILLQGSKLNGSIFPPWDDPPTADEFVLSQDGSFM